MATTRARSRARRKWVVARLRAFAPVVTGPMTGRRLAWVIAIAVVWLLGGAAVVIGIHMTYGANSDAAQAARAVASFVVALPAAFFAYFFPRRLGYVRSHSDTLRSLVDSLGELSSVVILNQGNFIPRDRAIVESLASRIDVIGARLRDMRASGALLCALDRFVRVVDQIRLLSRTWHDRLPTPQTDRERAANLVVATLRLRQSEPADAAIELVGRFVAGTREVNDAACSARCP